MICVAKLLTCVLTNICTSYHMIHTEIPCLIFCQTEKAARKWNNKNYNNMNKSEYECEKPKKPQSTQAGISCYFHIYVFIKSSVTVFLLYDVDHCCVVVVASIFIAFNILYSMENTMSLRFLYRTLRHMMHVWDGNKELHRFQFTSYFAKYEAKCIVFMIWVYMLCFCNWILLQQRQWLHRCWR